MNCEEAAVIFEKQIGKRVVQIERCGVGIANYVFIVSTAAEKFVLRCSKEEDAYRDAVHWLSKLSICEIPIPVVLSAGRHGDYSYLILSYIPGDDLGNVYDKLSSGEKNQIAKEIVAIQRKAAGIDISTDASWTWNGFIDHILNRAEKRMKEKGYFDAGKIQILRKMRQEIQEYLDAVLPRPYLDDVSTKNLLIYEGKLSGIVDIDWIDLGDILYLRKH